jgi:DNA-binding Lrp family transcriptional regulator
MSKKRIPFATGGWVNTQSSGDMPFGGEIVVNKEEQERLAELLKEPPKVDAVAVVSGEDLMRVVLPKRDMPKVAIDPKVLEKHKDMPTIMEQIEAARIEHRKTRLEDNHPVMEFLEDIIYCPSQIEFYFRDGEQVYCLYIRQRHGDTTAQLVPCFGSGDFDYDALWPEIELSREYDIEGESYCHDEREEQEIIAIEKDCLARLRVMFPDTPFPEHPNRRRGRYGERLPDVLL